MAATAEFEQRRQADLRLAERVRKACLEAAREGYESASMSGLCHEGAMEMSLDAIQRLALEPLLGTSRVASHSR